MGQHKEKLLKFLLNCIKDYSSDDDYAEICDRLIDRGCYLCSFIMTNGQGTDTIACLLNVF